VSFDISILDSSASTGFTAKGHGGNHRVESFICHFTFPALLPQPRR
jgi:hypothetical protein